MAHDDEKPDAGDDPWADLEAGLDAEGLPDLAGDFSFSFDEEESEDVPVTDELGASEPAAEEAPPVVADAAAGDPPAADPQSDEMPLEEGDPALVAPADADIDAWLADEAGPAEPDSEDQQAAVPADEAVAGSVHDDPWAELGDDPAGASSIDIGTGTSGIASASSIEALGDSAVDVDPFASLTESDDQAATADASEHDADASEHDANASGHDADPFAFEGAAAAAAIGGFPAGADGDASDAEPAERPTRKPATASRRPRKKKSSPIGQLIGVVVGGALSIPIVFAILIWGFGRDPFQLTPLVPESLAFLLPAKFQPGGGVGPAAGASLDAVLGDTGAATANDAEAPADTDLAVDDAAEPLPDLPGGEPDPVSPEPAVPEPTDLAMTDENEAEGNDLGNAEPADAIPDDPLMALIDEAETVTPVVTPPEPEPEPEPEPLDVGVLEDAVAGVSAALAAVAEMPDDPGDPDNKVRRRLFAKCYLALAAFADELAALEQLAAESGRPLEPALEEAAGLRQRLAAQPEVIELLPRLSRDWFAYDKRSGDGMVTVGTLVESRRFGPSWRSLVSCIVPGDDVPHEIIVLSRKEPAVAPGEEVIITGLAVDQDVVWAADMGAREPAAAEPPEATDIFSLPGL